MAKDAYYFKHDCNAGQDQKLIAVEKKFGYAGTGLFWRITEQMRSSDGYHLDYSELTFDSLAKGEFADIDKVKEFIDYCISIKLLIKRGEIIYSDRLMRDMDMLDEIREKRAKAGKASAAKRWGSPEEMEQMADPQLAGLMAFYEENNRRPIANAMECELLKDALDTHGFDKVKQAMKDYADKNIKYIVKVLDGNGAHKQSTTTTAEKRTDAVTKPLR